MISGLDFFKGSPIPAAGGQWSPLCRTRFGSKSWVRRRRWERSLVRQDAAPGWLRAGDPFRLSLYHTEHSGV